MTDLYLKFGNHIKTENVDGESTHFYKGEYSLDGDEWESAVLIFDSDFNSWQFYHQNKEEIEEVISDES